jgi:hypothetical protein
MDDPFLPWWSVLLLGMWSAAVTVWIHPSVHREMRVWAGLLTLVYIGLIFMALGGGPAVPNGKTTTSSHFGSRDLFLTVLIAISLTASVCSIGRLSSQCRTLCYVLLTLTNSGICVLLKQPEVAMGLVIVAGLNGRPLVRQWMRQKAVDWPDKLAEFTRFTPVPPDQQSEFGLIGSLTAIMALVLLGTISFSIHFETLGSTSSRSQNGLPTPDEIDRVLRKQADSNSGTSVIVLVLDRRADVVVLMAVIVFLVLAMSMTEPASAPMMASAQAELPRQPGEQS